MTKDTGPLRLAAVHGIMLLCISQGVKIVVQFASLVLFSRLLTPDDFGVAASVGPVIAFMSIFQDLGLQQVIIQRATVSQEDLTRIFWVAVLLGCVVAAFTAALSPVAAWFFHDRRLFWVTAVASITLLTSAVAAVPLALLNRHGRFRALALNDIVGSTVSFGVAITAALLGARYWSLVISTLATSIVTLLFAVWRAGWRPGMPTLAWPDRGLMHFGANLTGFTLVNFFARNSDNMMIGHVWGTIELGYYDRAYKLLLLPMQNVTYPITRVMLPLLSRIEADKPRLRIVYIRAVAQLGLALVPAIAAVLATAGTVISMLFGDRWAAVTPIFEWLGVAGLIQPINSTAGWIFISQARAESMFRLGLYTSSTAVLAFLGGLHWGAVGVAVAYTTSEYVLRLPVQYWWIGRVGPVSAMDLVSVQAPLLASAILTFVFSRLVLAEAFGLHNAALVASTLIVSYATAVPAIALGENGRGALQEGVANLMQLTGIQRVAPAK